ncbi:MAG TPA: M14 family metallopeptidase [Salinimicrobium sp.]|nr:M14 family metallopeptidase [Salinimicrobium sp.]
MKKLLILLLLGLTVGACDFSNYILESDYDFETVFEKSGGKETATYPEVIAYYEDLSSAFSTIKLMEMGPTDSGETLHLAIYNPDGNFDIENLREDHSVLLILNGIHPGESDGIDATMMLFRDLAQDSIPIPENTIIATVPVYNIGGALNRNSFSRANQNGPVSYGFRGNAKNYDLNRDFIKADTKNTQSFYEIFHFLKPDVFIDNHVSNGADYQYTLTHVFTQHDKLGGALGNYLSSRMIPALKSSLQEKDWDVTPYVNVFNEVPEKGFTQFMDYPRYSTGYASLWNTLGLMIETHMLKPYEKRVWGTYEMMRSMIAITDEDSELIRKLRMQAFTEYRKMEKYQFNFVADSTKPSSLLFKGYEASKIESKVTEMERLKYDRSKPFTKEITYYNNFKPTQEVTIPAGYIIPKAWDKVIELLELNEVEMQAFEKDTVLNLQIYHIEDFETTTTPYEGHYLHSNTKVSTSIGKIQIMEGDYYVSTDQPAIKYLLATLEPQAVDSFFNWNFFDSVLQQKEHFSPYVFEEVAEEILEDYPEIEDEFLAKKEEDAEFNQNWYAQLEWIYKKSEYYEKTHLRYPVFRLPR